VFFILTAVVVHVPQMTPDNMAIANVLKDTALAGGAFFMSGVFKKEEESQEGES